MYARFGAPPQLPVASQNFAFVYLAAVKVGSTGQ